MCITCTYYALIRAFHVLIMWTRCHLASIASKLKPIFSWNLTSAAGTGGGCPSRDPNVSKYSALPGEWGGNCKTPPRTAPGAAAGAAATCEGGGTKVTAYGNLNSLTIKAKQETKDARADSKNAITNRTRCELSLTKTSTASCVWCARAYASALASASVSVSVSASARASARQRVCAAICH